MQTRRRFIGTATALAALSLAPARAAVAGPVRMSLPAFASDATRVAALRNGIAAMKALPASDHRSYFFQAATHAYSDALLKPELKRDPGLKTVDRGKYWNQCPHFGQCSADFVIWHRAYLHFFERTLRAATGDESFALPYWDWTSLPQLPDSTFDGVLTPSDKTFESYTKGLATFTSFIKPSPTNSTA